MLQPKLRYLPQLDGVRAVAVLLVLWAHFPYVAGSAASQAFWKIGQFLRTGYIGVDLFFVLSGFLITRLLLDERARDGSISFRVFYIKRVLRIFPIYYLCVFIFALVYARGDGDLASLLTYTFNYYKPLHPAPTALEHTWSLSVEEQFYLVWPLLIATIPMLWGKWLTGIVVPALSLLTALLIAASFESTFAANVIYMSGPTRMMSLSLGAFLAFAEAAGGKPETRQAALLAVAGIAVLGIDNIARAVHLIPAGGFYWCAALVGYAMLSLGAVALLIGSENVVVVRVKALLCLPPVRYIGTISYGLYLYHYLILFLLDLAPYQVDTTGTTLTRELEAVTLTFLVAHLSFRYIESPLIKLKSRLRPPAAAGARREAEREPIAPR
jgi:peptidoglycan/LPS O-acetylase OafA/YrhL